jgi:hypothetical protein
MTVQPAMGAFSFAPLAGVRSYGVGTGYDLITGIGLPLGEVLALDPNF